MKHSCQINCKRGCPFHFKIKIFDTNACSRIFLNTFKSELVEVHRLISTERKSRSRIGIPPCNKMPGAPYSTRDENFDYELDML